MGAGVIIKFGAGDGAGLGTGVTMKVGSGLGAGVGSSVMNVGI
jgi:hypothetical protein